MTLRAAYTVSELAELMGWCDRSSPHHARHAAGKRMLRFLRARGVELLPVGASGRQYLVPLGAFAAAFPSVWAGILTTWRAAGMPVPAAIRCFGCGTSVPVPAEPGVSHLGHGGTRRDTATP